MTALGRAHCNTVHQESQKCRQCVNGYILRAKRSVTLKPREQVSSGPARNPLPSGIARKRGERLAQAGKCRAKIKRTRGKSGFQRFEQWRNILEPFKRSHADFNVSPVTTAKISRQPRQPLGRTRAAERAVKQARAVKPVKPRLTLPHQRMFEQRKQRHRRKPL